GVLHTGHWIVDTRGPEARETGGVSSTTVHSAALSDAEITAYVATGEPLAVAGAVTVDGLGGPFVRRAARGHRAVPGASLPRLRELLGELGVQVTDLWRG